MPQRHGDDGIRVRQPAYFALRNHHPHGLFQNAYQGLNVSGLRRLPLEVYRNHDVRAHLPHDVGRQIVH